jgi:glutathione S-transferase
MGEVILYTCGMEKNGPAFLHPCARAAGALDEAGHEYEIKQVGGYKLMPWTRRGDTRAEIERLTGQSDVPVLVLDDGETVAGSGRIADWAKANPA